MAERYIKCLIFRVRSSDTLDYSGAPDARWSVLDGQFEIAIAGSNVKITPKAHDLTETEARSAIESLLKRWEMEASVAESRTAIRFEFVRSEFAALNPDAGILLAESGSFKLDAPPLTLRVGRSAYPRPPNTEAFDNATERAYRRLQSVWEDDKYLTADAYYILTEIEDRFSTARVGHPRVSKKRRKAAESLAIDVAVLSKLGELTSERGGDRARKADGAKAPLTRGEEEWLKATLRLIFCRCLDYDANPIGQSCRIEMSDLPTLS